MAVTDKEIERTARLARLHIDPADLPVYTQNLNNLLALLDQITSVNTDSIEPMSHPMEGQYQRFREDKITETDQRSAFQALSTHAVEGLYIVPKVIE